MVNAYSNLEKKIDFLQIERWASEAGSNVTVNILKGLKPPPTPVDDSNPYWIAFKKATDEL